MQDRCGKVGGRLLQQGSGRGRIGGLLGRVLRVPAGPIGEERRGGVPDRQLCSGPGKLCQALAITRDEDGKAMRESAVRVLADGSGELPVVVTPRIGITKAADWPLRFVIGGSPWASRPAARPS